jgi:hypothetical protein
MVVKEREGSKLLVPFASTTVIRDDADPRQHGTICCAPMANAARPILYVIRILAIFLLII